MAPVGFGYQNLVIFDVLYFGELNAIANTLSITPAKLQSAYIRTCFQLILFPVLSIHQKSYNYFEKRKKDPHSQILPRGQINSQKDNQMSTSSCYSFISLPSPFLKKSSKLPALPCQLQSCALYGNLTSGLIIKIRWTIRIKISRCAPSKSSSWVLRLSAKAAYSSDSVKPSSTPPTSPPWASISRPIPRKSQKNCTPFRSGTRQDRRNFGHLPVPITRARRAASVSSISRRQGHSNVATTTSTRLSRRTSPRSAFSWWETRLTFRMMARRPEGNLPRSMRSITMNARPRRARKQWRSSMALAPSWLSNSAAAPRRREGNQNQQQKSTKESVTAAGDEVNELLIICILTQMTRFYFIHPGFGPTFVTLGKKGHYGPSSHMREKLGGWTGLVSFIFCWGLVEFRLLNTPLSKEFSLFQMKESDKHNGNGLLVNKNLIEYLPVKCKMYLNLLISVKEDNFNSIPKIIRKNYENFSSVFQNLDEAERSYFINKNIEFVRQRLNQNAPLIFTPPSICDIQTTCEVKTTFMKMTFWQKRTIKYEYNFQRVKFWTSKKMDVLQLKYYLIRRSHSQKNGLVMQSFDPIINEKYQKIAFKFNNAAVCDQIFEKIRDSVIQLSFKRTECLLYDDLKDQKDLKMAQEKQAMDFTILTSKNINEFFEEKENFIDKLRRGKRQTYEIYSKSKITVLNSMASSKLYYLEYNLPESWTSLVKIRQNIKILGCISVSNQYTCEILEKFNTNVSANYYRIRSQNEEFELIMIVQQSEKDGQLQQIMKSTKSIYFGVNVPFMEISIKKGKDKHYVMTINAIIKKNPHKKMCQNQQIIIKFLTGLVKTSFQQAQISSKDGKMAFLSPEKPHYLGNNRNTSLQRSKSLRKQIKNMTCNLKNQSPGGQIRLQVPYEQRSSQEDSPKEEVFYSIEDILDEQIEDNQKIKDIFYSISSKMIDNKQLHRFTENYGFQKQQPAIKYLYAKCVNSPSQKPPMKYITEHNLKVDWQKSAKGGVICINKEAIEEQKKFVKLIFNQLGSKIFQMKGFANFSLPIQICRPQSSLISIGRNISYAPMLLQNNQAMKPLERMKNMVILHISWCALALSTQKPFNPILGETYQGFINGCPIFLQQVCHHPAISYLYFVGRGYKIYGQVEPKAQIRLNYINAPSQQMLHVDFDNGDKCQFSVPMLVINGLLIGQRSIYYDGVGHVIDVKNNLIAEVRFNAKNNSIFKSKENPDFFMGEIYQVTQSFMNKFLASNRKISFKKDDKNRQLESISGQWNGALLFNGQKSFDFQQQLPALLQNSECPLASDSVYREDVICRSAGDLVKGQQQKERLEQAQRRDKKMRNEYKQSKK